MPSLRMADTARPMVLEKGIKRTVDPMKDAQSEHRSRSQPEVGLRAAPSSGMSRSTRGSMTPVPAYRGAKTRRASRPGANSHTAVSLRVPAATSTRRMATLAAGSRRAAAHAAQSYIDSANRQMDR
jgi:hypothetical protein